MDEAMEKCISTCTDCARTCEETIVHCLEMGGEHAQAAHLLMLMDCAKIGQTSATLMLHDSEFANDQCGICERICNACAEECDRFDDDTMKNCAQVCRDCAHACHEMAH